MLICASHGDICLVEASNIRGERRCVVNVCVCIRGERHWTLQEMGGGRAEGWFRGAVSQGMHESRGNHAMRLLESRVELVRSVPITLVLQQK